jgi:Tfp pilus assembly protein PilN
LNVDVQVADIRRGGPQLRILKALTEDDSNRYVAAYGLSLRDPAFLPRSVPIVNLFAYENIRVGVKEDKSRKFRLALVASCVLMACGVITAVMGTIRAREAADALVKSQSKLAATQALEQAKANEVAQRAERLRMLEAEGVPVRSLIQSIVRAVPTEVGLTNVKMAPLSTEVAGETISETSIIRMSDLLRGDPLFSSVSLAWFEQVNPAIPAAGMRFRMLMQSPAPAPPPPAAPVTSPPPASALRISPKHDASVNPVMARRSGGKSS